MHQGDVLVLQTLHVSHDVGLRVIAEDHQTMNKPAEETGLGLTETLRLPVTVR